MVYDIFSTMVRFSKKKVISLKAWLMVYLVYVEIVDCSILQRFHIYVCKSTSVHST